MCTTTTESTQKSTYAPLSPEGEQYNALFTNMLLSQLQEGGYDVNPTQKTVYQDQGAAGSIQAQIDDLSKRLDEAKANQASNPPPAAGSKGFGNRGVSLVGSGAFNGGASSNNDVSKLQNQLDAKKEELSKLPQTTYTDYQLQKQEDPRVLAAIDKYGANAPEVSTMRQQVKDEKTYTVQATADIQKTFLQNVQKFTKGDYSYTPEQEAQIDKFVAPIKGMITSSTDKLLQMADTNYTDLVTSMADITHQIDQTGFAVEDALKAASATFDKSGATLMDSLKAANSSAYARDQFQFNLLEQQADQKAAQQAAMLGLPPGSMAEKNAALKMKTDALKSLELDAANREAQGALQIQGMVEQGKQKIDLSRVALAESQGEKKETLAGQKTGLLAQTGAQKLQLTAGGQQALLDLEKGKQAQLYNAALGGLPSMIQGGSGALAFLQNQSAATQQQGLQLMQPVQNQLAIQQQRQANEATTDSTQKTSQSFLGTLGSILGGAAGVAGGVMSGIGAMNAIPSLAAAGGSTASAALNAGTSQSSQGFNLGNYWTGLG